ncbi:MAG: hypothetical protein JSS36_03485 [Proteobacteria bacterium]|nr:hypothetical protein [Pseudomonadota bacterium]
MITALRGKLALALTAALAAAPLPAMAAGPQVFTATLKAPLAAPRQAIIDGQMWNCTGDTCTAPDEGQRAAAICGQVARKFGELTHFVASNKELTADKLARCNTGR